MFLKLKKNFAKMVLTALTLQVIFLGLGGSTGKAFAADVPASINGPKLVSVTADLGGTPQTVLAGTNLSALVGQSVGTITATVSETSTFVGSLRQGLITISGETIPEGTAYGTFIIDPSDGTKLIITPNAGNDVLALAGTFTFTVASDQIQDNDGLVNSTTTFGLEVGISEAPKLVSVTADLGGTPQTVLAGTNLSALVGQSVGTITATVSETSTFVGSLRQGLITISGETIPEGTAYGTFIIDPSDGTKLIITPNAGNDVLALAGTFTFTVASDQIQSISGTKNCNTIFSLVVGKYKVLSIGSIIGKTEIGSTLIAGSLTPADATVLYQWQSAPTVDGDYTDIVGANNSSYTLTTSDLGQFIRVVVSGTFDYIGSANSTSTITSVSEATPILPESTPTVKLASNSVTTIEADTYVEPYVGSDSVKDQGTVTSTTESKNSNNDNNKKDNNLPIWAIVLLVVIAAIGGYLIYNQKPTVPQTSILTKKKTEAKVASVPEEKETLTKKTDGKKSKAKITSKNSPKTNTKK